MPQLWTILDDIGAVEVTAYETPSFGSHPKDNGAPWQTGWTATRIDARPDPAIERWTGSAWEVDLAPLRLLVTERVNAGAEAIRARFLTPGTGQAMTYTRKEAEARAWVPGTDAALFPFLAAEAAACGMSLADVVTTVLSQADAWVTVGAQIEALRRGATVAIGTAGSRAAITAAADVDWSAFG